MHMRHATSLSRDQTAIKPQRKSFHSAVRRAAMVEALELRALMSTTIWSSATIPTIPEFDDSSSLELGMRFRSDQSGLIDGVRFYKGAGNTGTHVASLWSSSGTLLGQ